MRDDEDDDPVPEGKVLHAGFHPEAERAWYALPPGVSALEGCPPDFEEDDVPSRNPAVFSRRVLFGLGVAAGLVLGATGSWWIAQERRVVSQPPRIGSGDDIDAILRLAHRFVEGPFEQLIDNHATFLWIVDQHGRSDPPLVDGVVRLAKFAPIHRGATGLRIARRIVQTFDDVRVPPSLEPALPILRELLRRVPREKR
ncbi:MAG: hypothetical protein H6837_20645 [Planctomycetes bacterium]|nr:hypothetical protein [Planctomycetota bacterium]